MKLKNKGKLSSDTVRKEPSRKLNPFEVHINRSKHHVLGRKLKSDRGLPGVSKNKALMKRKKTLLQEYKIRGKSNQFIDQRIGERNKYMTEDDRIMARFAAERLNVFKKKAMFNLSDTEVLTHKGQTLSEIERFEDTRSDDDEDDEGRRTSGALKGKFVESAHFGGGMLTKSKQDRESLIDELINESKKRKAERQRNKEETLEATEQLDEEWKTLGMIVTSTKDTGDVNNQKKDQYDIVMRQLKFEPHGQPSQRLKTEEEIAKEDKEQLERLEKERLKQLREIEVNKYGAHKSADDLDDGFGNFGDELTENDLAEGGSEAESDSDGDKEINEEEIEEGKEEDEEEDVEEGEEDDENNESELKRSRCANNEKESEGTDIVSKNMKSEEDEEKLSLEENIEDNSDDESSDDECAMDDFSDLMPPVNDAVNNLPTHETVACQSKTTEINMEKNHSEAKLDAKLDLPFILNIPDSYESFKDLLGKRSFKEQNLIFERLIKSNHPSLEPGNKRKMLSLAEYVVEFVSKGDVMWESLAVFVSQFHVLKEFNKEECLKMLADSFSTKLEEFARDAVPLVKYLAWYILVFLRPQGMDVLVPISKPPLNLVCRLISSTPHVTLGLLGCYLLLQDAQISSVVYPEAITYLHTCIKSATDPERKISENEQENTQLELNTKEETTGDFRLHLDFENNTTEDHKALYCSVMLLSGFVKVYRKYPQSKIIFKEVQLSVSNIKADAYPSTLKKEIIELQTLLHVLNSAHLSCLAKSAKKPKALRQYEPSFHTVTVGKYQRGLPAEQQEEQKLLHKYKHEMKGAMRELRRDRAFLANVRLKEKALSDEQRMRKVKEIFSSAAAQQGELRSLKRKK